MKKLLALMLAMVLTSSMLAGCGAKNGGSDDATKAPASDDADKTGDTSNDDLAKNGKVYFLNFKPEVAEKLLKNQPFI